jgi:hypothetical protein
LDGGQRHPSYSGGVHQIRLLWKCSKPRLDRQFCLRNCPCVRPEEREAERDPLSVPRALLLPRAMCTTVIARADPVHAEISQHEAGLVARAPPTLTQIQRRFAYHQQIVPWKYYRLESF